jgi:hypothetical protein
MKFGCDEVGARMYVVYTRKLRQNNKQTFMASGLVQICEKQPFCREEVNFIYDINLLCPSICNSTKISQEKLLK